MNSISANLNVMIKACEKASKILIRDFGELEKLQVSKKGPRDFVTNSDVKAEKIIIEELKKARPNYSIISEENGVEKNKDTSNSWIIDPIDGTINFLHGIPHFAISIALKSDDEIICGLIFDPIKDEMFYAEKNNGAFFNNQRIRVSKKNNLDECLFAVGKLKNEPSFTYRRSGCAALDIAYVASGRLDGYAQSNLNLWDIAAGIVLIKEAGGMINDIDLNNIKNIKDQIDEAEKLKEDAKNILTEHEKKISNSKAEVKQMINKASEEAERNVIKTNQDFHNLMDSRKKNAEEKIKQLKNKALKDIKNASVKVAIESVEKLIKNNFDLSPRGIREMLSLNKPIYECTSAYGHFGRKPRSDGSFSWEKTDKIEVFKK